jgi:uncharacterized protein
MFYTNLAKYAFNSCSWSELMLVSFSIQNYRPFAERQTFSLVAGTAAARKPQYAFESGNSFAPNLLRSASLFGANGVGKSSLITALSFFMEFVLTSAKESQKGEPIKVVPFKLDAQFSEEPTEIEVVFIVDDTLYQYGFAVDQERVWGEWLFARSNIPRSRLRRLFQREYDPGDKQYHWDMDEKRIKGNRKVWQEETLENGLFLSMAVKRNSQELAVPFLWMASQLHVISSPQRLSHNYTAKQCLTGGWEKRVLNMLQGAGIAIVDLEVNKQDITINLKQVSGIPEELHEEIVSDLKRQHGIKVALKHPGRDGKPIFLPFDEESDGTQVLFSLAGPWLDVLDSGATLFVDELHNSLHPHALHFLVGLFNNPETNPNNAQLIFTSHETSVMAKGMLHKDQIWLMEKEKKQAARLIPLSDFKVRDVNAFQKAYLDGRYGAVPIIREFTHAP